MTKFISLLSSLWFKILLCFCVFLISLVLFMPLQAVLPKTIMAGRTISGTLSKAEVIGPLHRDAADRTAVIRLKASLLSLLTLSYQAAIDLKSSDINATADIRVFLDGSFDIQGGTAMIPVQSLPLPLPLEGSVVVRDMKMLFDTDRTCVRGSAQIESTILQQSSKILAGWNGPLLSGTLSCTAGVLAAQVSADSTQTVPDAKIDMKLTKSDFDVTITVKVEENNSKIAFQAIGFKSLDSSRMMLRVQGNWS